MPNSAERRRLATRQKACITGRSRSPLTGRCAWPTQRSREKCMRRNACSPGSVRNERTGRCMYASRYALLMSRPCPPGLKRSPKTARCSKHATKLKSPTSWSGESFAVAPPGHKYTEWVPSALKSGSWIEQRWLYGPSNSYFPFGTDEFETRPWSGIFGPKPPNGSVWRKGVGWRAPNKPSDKALPLSEGGRLLLSAGALSRSPSRKSRSRKLRSPSRKSRSPSRKFW